MWTLVCGPLSAWAWRCSLGTSPTHRERTVRQYSAPWRRQDGYLLLALGLMTFPGVQSQLTL